MTIYTVALLVMGLHQCKCITPRGYLTAEEQKLLLSFYDFLVLIQSPMNCSKWSSKIAAINYNYVTIRLIIYTSLQKLGAVL